MNDKEILTYDMVDEGLELLKLYRDTYGEMGRNSYFSEKIFKDLILESKDFSMAVFDNTEFKDSKFNRSEFKYSKFYNSRFKDLEFKDSVFKDSQFNGSRFYYLEFYHSKFNGSKFNNSEFYHSKFNGSKFKDSKFYDSEFYDSSFWNTKFMKCSGIKAQTIYMERDTIAYVDGIVSIGCITKPITEWLECYEDIGKEANYTEEQIRVYGKMLSALHGIYGGVEL